MIRLIRNIILTAIVLFLLFSLTKNIFSYKDKLAFYHDYRREYEAESELNKNLKSDLEKSSDYYSVEKQIREKLNRLQPGEVSIILPQITPTPTPSPIVKRKTHEQWYDLLIK